MCWRDLHVSSSCWSLSNFTCRFRKVDPFVSLRDLRCAMICLCSAPLIAFNFLISVAFMIIFEIFDSSRLLLPILLSFLLFSNYYMQKQHQSIKTYHPHLPPNCNTPWKSQIHSHATLLQINLIPKTTTTKTTTSTLTSSTTP